jgi:hypothetical protein
VKTLLSVTYKSLHFFNGGPFDFGSISNHRVDNGHNTGEFGHPTSVANKSGVFDKAKRNHPITAPLEMVIL